MPKTPEVLEITRQSSPTRPSRTGRLGQAVVIALAATATACDDVALTKANPGVPAASDSGAPEKDNGVTPTDAMPVDASPSKDMGQGADMGPIADAAVADAQSPDAASPDADRADAALADAELPDAQLPDAALADAAIIEPDAANCRELPVDEGCYDGPAETLNVGICRPGTTMEICQLPVVSAQCIDDVEPAAADRYGNLLDDECNGQTDDVHRRLQGSCEAGATVMQGDDPDYVCQDSEWRTIQNGGEFRDVPQLHQDDQGNRFAVLRLRVPANVQVSVRAMNYGVVPPVEVTSRTVPCDTPQVDASFPVQGGDTSMCVTAPALGDGFNFPGARMTYVINRLEQ